MDAPKVSDNRTEAALLSGSVSAGSLCHRNILIYYDILIYYMLFRFPPVAVQVVGSLKEAFTKWG